MTQIGGITGNGGIPASGRGTGQATLGQADFLTLLTAQMQNQDPLNPMDNAQFMSQMAQFSTVAGIGELNEGVAGLGAGLRISAAANLIGRSVLVDGAIARPDGAGAIRGAVDLDRGAEGLIVSYSDAATGALLHSETLAGQGAGRVSFGWEGLPPDLAAARSAVRVSVSALREGQTEALAPRVYARVVSASAAGPSDLTLQVEDFGALNSLEVDSLR